MVSFTPITTDEHLQQIIALQIRNLPQNITSEELKNQGFVTVQHDFATLKSINDAEQGILMLDEDKVIGYLLAMTTDLRDSIPILKPMFKTFDQLTYQGRELNDYQYIVVGQVCIDKAYRGQGLLDQAYIAYRELLSPTYDFAITEIATRNQRSLRGHHRVGFQTIHEYVDPGVEEWAIVLWDWQT